MHGDNSHFPKLIGRLPEAFAAPDETPKICPHCGSLPRICAKCYAELEQEIEGLETQIRKLQTQLENALEANRVQMPN